MKSQTEFLKNLRREFDLIWNKFWTKLSLEFEKSKKYLHKPANKNIRKAWQEYSNMNKGLLGGMWYIYKQNCSIWISLDRLQQSWDTLLSTYYVAEFIVLLIIHNKSFGTFGYTRCYSQSTQKVLFHCCLSLNCRLVFI